MEHWTDVYAFARVAPGDAEAIAARMRKADVDEVLASGGFTPLEAIRYSLDVSEAKWSLHLRGELAAIFGIATLGNGEAGPWALTSDVVEKHPIAFYRASKVAIRFLSKHYPRLVQDVDARNTQSLRWLAKLGFRVDPEARPHGKAGLPFHHVTLEESANV